MDIIRHTEKYINKISEAIKITDCNYNITVSVYNETPFSGLKTYSTLGLSSYNIKNYYELVFVCNDDYLKEKISSSLISFAEYLISENLKILRGDTFSFNHPIFEGSKMDSFYISLPFYFDNEFQVLNQRYKNVIFPLLIPLYREEADLVRSKGWSIFEEYLLDNEIDNLWDLRRKKIVW